MDGREVVADDSGSEGGRGGEDEDPAAPTPTAGSSDVRYLPTFASAVPDTASKNAVTSPNTSGEQQQQRARRLAVGGTVVRASDVVAKPG